MELLPCDKLFHIKPDISPWNSFNLNFTKKGEAVLCILYYRHTKLMHFFHFINLHLPSYPLYYFLESTPLTIDHFFIYPSSKDLHNLLYLLRNINDLINHHSNHFHSSFFLYSCLTGLLFDF